MANALKVLVGADPELFLVNDKGTLISAHDILPGTKIEPHPVTRGAIQVDGVAAEFNIDPASDSKMFVRNIKDVMDQLKGYAKGNAFAIQPFAVFEPSYFNSLPELTRELGCNPDFNAWTGQVNEAPNGDTTMRTASGHVHIGWCTDVNPTGKSHFMDCRTLIKQLDYYLGLYSLLWDPDNTRRQMYGKAGAFRPKSYGAEYRVLSNVWLKSPLLQAWIFDAVQQAVHHLMTQKKSMEDQFGDFAQQCINKNDTTWITSKEGQRILSLTDMPMPDLSELSPKKAKKELTEEEHSALQWARLRNKARKMKIEMD